MIIDGYISEITFGTHVPAHTLKQVEANIPELQGYFVH